MKKLMWIDTKNGCCLCNDTRKKYIMPVSKITFYNEENEIVGEFKGVLSPDFNIEAQEEKR